MIFRKHLCGGFGILMSQNYHVEKNLVFQCCAKMVGLLQHGSILHGLNSQVTPKDSQSSFDIPKYHPDTPRLSLRHPKTSPNSIRHYRHRRISSIIQGASVYEELNKGGTIITF